MTDTPAPLAARSSGAGGRARSALSRHAASPKNSPVGGKPAELAAAKPEPPVGKSASTLPRDEEEIEGLATTTSRIVHKAASILEEELRAGINAAQQVERQFLNVSALRGGHSEAVMQRFRRDAHEVVDMLIDVVSAATNAVGSLAQRVVTFKSGSGDESKAGSRKTLGAALTLTSPRSFLPGETAEIPVLLENDSDSATEQFQLRSSDLMDAVSAGRIPAQQVSFTPSPLRIGPRDSVKVMVAVAIPIGTPAGSYAGLVQASQLEHLRAILQVQVG